MKKTILLQISLMVMTVIAISGCAGKEHENPRNHYYSEIRSVNKLVLARMEISKLATIDDFKLSEAQGMQQIATGLINAVKIGDRKAAYSYNTYLQAFLDLSTLTPDDVEVSEADKTITLTLPAIQTEFAGRDMQFREEHYRVTGLRSRIDPEERAAYKEKMNASLKEEVEKKPLFRDKITATARNKADAYFRSILEKDGYTVIVTFKNS